MLAGRSLVKLDISDNPLTADVIPALCQLVQHQPHLQALNLNDTGLTDDGVVQVCQVLAQGAPDLQDLGLALNEVGSAGARGVALVLASKAGLVRLSVRENELGDRGELWRPSLALLVAYLVDQTKIISNVLEDDGTETSC